MNEAIIKEFHSGVSGMQDEYSWSNLCHLLSGALTYGIPGDVCEIGCNQGRTSVLLQRVMDFHREQHPLFRYRQLHLYDSFQGMGEWSPEDAGSMQAVATGELKSDPSIVRGRFAERGLSQPKIHPGWVEDTIPGELPAAVAFALVDLDLYGPMLHALRHVYDRVPRGGVIVIDDYYMPGIKGAQAAANEFFADKPEGIQASWQCGAAFVRKGDGQRVAGQPAQFCHTQPYTGEWQWQQ